MKLYIPEPALENHIGFLGGTGSGKTSAAKREIAERKLKEGKRVIIIDPTDVWWGLRLKADGETKGYPIHIFGGRKADFPLRAQDAEVLADAFAKSSDSAIFVTKEMTVADRTAFFTKFAETLLRRNRGAVWLIIDESHILLPQAGAQAGGGAPAMLHAGNNLVSLGRASGFRITLLSQRPAKLHKDALSQVQTLVSMRVLSPQDRKAIREWMEDQADAEKGREIISSLPKLRPGQGWVWSPIAELLEQVHFDMPTTFDSSKPPEDDGDGPTLKPLDPEGLKARLATIEADRKANDPAELKKRIRELESKPSAVVSTGISKDDLEDAEERADFHLRTANQALQDARTLALSLGNIVTYLEKRTEDHDPKSAPTVAPPKRAALQIADGITAAMRTPAPASRPISSGNCSLPEGERAVLTAAAQNGQSGATREEVSILTGYKRSSRDTYIQRARSKGLIDVSGDRVIATPEGVVALGPSFEPLPTGAALRDYWMNRLPEGERKILGILVANYPVAVDRDQLSDATGYKRSSRDTYLQRLSTRRLVVSLGRGEVKANDNLF